MRELTYEEIVRDNMKLFLTKFHENVKIRGYGYGSRSGAVSDHIRDVVEVTAIVCVDDAYHAIARFPKHTYFLSTRWLRRLDDDTYYAASIVKTLCDVEYGLSKRYFGINGLNCGCNRHG